MSAVLKNSIVLIMQPHFIRSIAVSSLCLSIVACSNDVDVTDVDVFVYLSDGSLFMKDDDRSALAIVKFECTYSQQVKIVIKNYSSLTPNYASTIRYFIAWY